MNQGGMIMTNTKKILTAAVFMALGLGSMAGCDYSKGGHGKPYSYHGPMNAAAPNASTSNSTTTPTTSNSNPNAPDPASTPPAPGPVSPLRSVSRNVIGMPAGTRSNNHMVAHNNMAATKYEPPFSLSANTSFATPNINGPACTGSNCPPPPAAWNASCADQEAIVGYQLSATFNGGLNQINKIGCKNINSLGTAGIHWVDVSNAGGPGGTATTVIAPRTYVMTGFSAQALNSPGQGIIAEFQPYARATDSTLGLYENWTYWNNYGFALGQGGNPALAIESACPAGNVLVGLSGDATATSVTSLTGVCKHLDIPHPQAAIVPNFSLGNAATLSALGNANGPAASLTCPTGQVIVSVTGQANANAIDQLQFGCTNINNLNDETATITGTQTAGGNGGGHFEAFAPRGYAITGFDVLLDPNTSALIDLNPRFAPLSTENGGVMSDPEFVFELPFAIVGNDPTLPNWSQGDRCAVGSVLTGVSVTAQNQVNSVQATCQAVTAH